MTLDKATATLVARAAATARPLAQMSLDEARQSRAAPPGQPGPPIASVRDARVAAAGGAIPIRILIPRRRPRAVIVYYHPGGWALGSLEESDAITRILASRTGCAVISVGYRLAPDYRYPTAAEDAWSALQWAAGHVDDIAGRPVPIIVAGEGSGGNLAAVVARRSSQRNGPPLHLQVLVCPVTDCDFDSLSYTDPASQLLLDRDAMIWFWDMYAPEPGARTHPDASPLQAVFLSGLPPAVIVTAEHDVLRDEGELYAMRLVQAGVPVEHRRFDGQMHGFFSMTGILPASEEGIDYVADAIRRCT